MSNEVGVAYSWILSTLANDSVIVADAPGGLQRAYMPPGSLSPYVVMIFDPNKSKDYPVFGGGRAYSDLCFSSMVIGNADDTETIINAASRIDQLITVAQTTTIAGGTLLSSIRDTPVFADTIIEGEQMTSIGGDYHLLIVGA